MTCIFGTTSPPHFALLAADHCLTLKRTDGAIEFRPGGCTNKIHQVGEDWLIGCGSWAVIQRAAEIIASQSWPSLEELSATLSRGALEACLNAMGGDLRNSSSNILLFLERSKRLHLFEAGPGSPRYLLHEAIPYHYFLAGGLSQGDQQTIGSEFANLFNRAVAQGLHGMVSQFTSLCLAVEALAWLFHAAHLLSERIDDTLDLVAILFENGKRSIFRLTQMNSDIIGQSAQDIAEMFKACESPPTCVSTAREPARDEVRRRGTRSQTSRSQAARFERPRPDGFCAEHRKQLWVRPCGAI